MQKHRRKEFIMNKLSGLKKYISLLLTGLFITAGIAAQNTFAGYLANHTKLGVRKTASKNDGSVATKLALLEDHLITEKEKSSEDQVVHAENEQEKSEYWINLEPDMFDSDQREIKDQFEWEEEPVEEPSEIEEWMLHFEPISDHWLKNQNFFIL